MSTVDLQSIGCASSGTSTLKLVSRVSTQRKSSAFSDADDHATVVVWCRAWCWRYHTRRKKRAERAHCLHEEQQPANHTRGERSERSERIAYTKNRSQRFTHVENEASGASGASASLTRRTEASASHTWRTKRSERITYTKNRSQRFTHVEKKASGVSASLTRRAEASASHTWRTKRVERATRGPWVDDKYALVWVGSDSKKVVRDEMRSQSYRASVGRIPFIWLHGMPFDLHGGRIPSSVAHVLSAAETHESIVKKRLLGVEVLRRFGGQDYRGVVTTVFPGDEPMYQVVYEDGDLEDMYLHELESCVEYRGKRLKMNHCAGSTVV